MDLAPLPSEVSVNIDPGERLTQTKRERAKGCNDGCRGCMPVIKMSSSWKYDSRQKLYETERFSGLTVVDTDSLTGLTVSAS